MTKKIGSTNNLERERLKPQATLKVSVPLKAAVRTSLLAKRITNSTTKEGK